MIIRHILCGCISLNSAKKEKNQNGPKECSLKFCVNGLAKALSQEILLNDERNAVYSPYGIMGMLCMTLVGANASTFREIKKTMCFKENLPVLAIIEQFSTLFKSILQEKGDDVEFLNVSKALFEQDIKIKNCYVNLLETQFKSSVDRGDFKKNAAEEVKRVNQSIADTTNGKIPNIIPSDYLDSAKEAIFLNASYFKANWLFTFDRSKTEMTTFYLLDGSEQKTDMMFAQLEADYSVFPDLLCSAIRLKLNNSQFKVMFILPHEKNGLPELLNKLVLADNSDANFAELLRQDNFCRRRTQIWLPKFKMQQKLPLKDTLSNLGMSSAFQHTAQFDGITDFTQMFLDQIIHESVFEIDEKGAQASEETEEESMEYSPTISHFKADHPFLFALLSSNDSVLSLGRLCEPSL